MNAGTVGCVVTILCMVAGLVGCAGTPPKPEFKQALAVKHQVDAQDTLTAMVTAGPGIEILDLEKTRIAQRIEERVGAKQIANASSGTPSVYRVELLLTRYEKGNAFARAMLAGLGQIHIDGTLTVFLEPEGTQVTQFDIRKTFAWGGIYGGATGMEDIEYTFADGIAATLTGQEEDTPRETEQPEDVPPAGEGEPR